MSENVQIVLIIAAGLVIVLFIFRRQLSDFRFKGGKDGVDMQLKTKKTDIQPKKSSTSTSVSNNKLWGRKNKIDVQTNNVSVDDNQLIGEDQEISVHQKTTKKK